MAESFEQYQSIHYLDYIRSIISSLLDENHSLKRSLEEIKKENNHLKDNEEEMPEVSSIIITCNENTRLKNYINILEKQLSMKTTYDNKDYTSNSTEANTIEPINEHIIDVVEEESDNIFK